MSEERDVIRGKLKQIVFRNDDNGYTVARFIVDDLQQRQVTITGYLPVFSEDALMELSGSYVDHPRYGMQFQVETFHRVMPDDEDSLIRFLSGPLFEGIGKKYAETIVAALGKDAIHRIKNDPTVLDSVPKMTSKRRTAILEGLKESDDDLENLIQFFVARGLGMRNVMKLERIYGKEAVEKIQENPYRMVDEVDGIGFATADKVAMSLGFELEDPRRLEAAMVALVDQMNMQSGDTFVSREGLAHQMKRQCAGLTYDFDELLESLLLQRRLVEEEGRIYHVDQYDAEVQIAQFLTLFPFEELEPVDPQTLQFELDALQEKLAITYDQAQLDAIHTFFKHDAMILTGGPGTGKTTVVRALTALFKKLYPYQRIACCAPTGRAAKRLAELTETDTFTIHSLLGWDLESNTFTKTEQDPLIVDLLIIDEFSMVDSWLFAALCKASVHVKKLCIIGDEDQLPSVRCGCVLKDLITSELFPLVRLERIFRQSEGSDVITLAHQIRQGQTEELDCHGDVAFFLVGLYEIKDQVINVVQSALNKGYDIQDIQVLASKYNGPAGIDRLNAALQQCLNPPEQGKREWKAGYRTFREGDKILQLKNQPDDDVYNGDIGMLVEIVYANEDEAGKNRLIVDFEGILVEYTSDNLLNISHAYCISVHKSQGSEYPIVIMPVVRDYGIMLQRRLIYTGVTRAKKSLVLLGEKDALIRGIASQEHHLRSTTLTQRIAAMLNPEF
ncbi:ATP-dependent RecD-like DNA helicase [Holdemania filiformis]|uniref:SF1B family DNA helicase RecD2 n=1 Tax=Holdemania filiformis TaxID=61171 RepID=UPI00242D65BA|nr:ATP-dependent RecD-like DNA helicase [Holdemania filiformis]